MDNFSGIYFNYIDINYIYINKKELTFLYDTVKGVFLIDKKNLKRCYDQLHFFTGSIDAILQTTTSLPLFGWELPPRMRSRT